jgi:hypothetical protein
VENKKHRQSDARKARGVIPFYFFVEIQHRENGKDRERDDLLNGLELRRAEFIGANAVRRNLEAVLKKSDSPAHQDHFPESGGAVLQVAIPGKSHEDVRNGQQDNGSHVFLFFLLECSS